MTDEQKAEREAIKAAGRQHFLLERDLKRQAEQRAAEAQRQADEAKKAAQQNH